MPSAVVRKSITDLTRRKARTFLLGWLIGLPAGYLLARAIIALTASVTKIDLEFAFPPVNLAITLVGTIVLALLVLLAPVRRAVRFKPGEALRYA